MDFLHQEGQDALMIQRYCWRWMFCLEDLFLRDYYGYWKGYCSSYRSRYLTVLTLLYSALLLSPLLHIHIQGLESSNVYM
ncbi:hypothetical protein BYT27DRAFT_6488689 [Phlegmacium glaucopus]|nr:hypothetical protein BYT27DRAFT_6488689 [Phlegmacium glaucopus]